MSNNGTALTEEQLANLSDEEIMNMAVPPTVMDSSDPAPEDDPSGEAEVLEVGDDDVAETPDANDDPAAGAASDDGDPDAGDAAQVTGDEPAPLNEDGAQVSDADAGTGDADPEPKTGDTADDPDASGSGEADDADPSKKKDDSAKIDYEALYKEIMAPFKANGKIIELQNPQEAVQLMQMGANYTKKMQALQPHLKLVRMLERHNLTEDKLSFLIDLDKKDPAAIQKYMRDSNIDPLDVDTTSEPNYVPGQNKISDAEHRFNQMIEEVTSTDTGRELVLEIDKSWDDQSKQALWKEPQMIKILSEQRENGLYAQISSEVERQRTLGKLSGVSFIEAYYQVGQAMQQQGLLTPKQSANPAPSPAPQAQQAQPQPRVLDQRSAKPKPQATDSARVRAASPMKAKPAANNSDFNPLSMSDEEFEKQAGLAAKF